MQLLQHDKLKILAKTSTLLTSQHAVLQNNFVLIPQYVVVDILLFPVYNLKQAFARKLLIFFKLMSFEYLMTVG